MQVILAYFIHLSGFAGAAISIDVYCHRKINGDSAPYPPIKPYKNEGELIAYIKTRLALVDQKPNVFVMGALGRCGKGAVDLCKGVGLDE
jgi:saccharopine dehydrogenase (NAD+, L-lysine-forming)